MNCLIVDDDDLTRMEVEKLVSKTPFLKLVKSCSGAREAFNILSGQRIDLIFLDIMMPEMTGLELMQALYKEKPHVILMSLNKELAMEAFDYDVTDFLAKPISQERFMRAVSKAKRVYDNEKKNDEATAFIFAKIDLNNLVKIHVQDILYIEALGDYLNICTPAKMYTTLGTFKSILHKLSEKDFLRVHNSFIVRLDKINSIEGTTIIINQKLIPVSRLHRNELMQRLNLI
jgi:DNA-binding LytR/AlgR family response regulator